MILYFLARDVFAMGTHLKHEGILPSGIKGYPLLAGLVWGFSLYLYEVRKESIQGSLQRSMTFVFK